VTLGLVVVVVAAGVVCFTVAAGVGAFVACAPVAAGVTAVLLVVAGVEVEPVCLVVASEGWTLAACTVPESFFAPKSAGFKDALASVVAFVGTVPVVEPLPDAVGEPVVVDEVATGGVPGGSTVLAGFPAKEVGCAPVFAV